MPFLFERGSTSPLFSFCFPFPLEYSLLLIHDGLTACFAFSVDRQSGHSSTLVQEMPTSLTSPSLKSGMTHVSFPNCIHIGSAPLPTYGQRCPRSPESRPTA